MPVEAQAPVGTFLCVATCPNGRNYVPNSSVSGPSNCRYAQVDCLSFAGTTLPCDDDVIQMTTLTFETTGNLDDMDACIAYDNTIRAAQRAFDAASASRRRGLRAMPVGSMALAGPQEPLSEADNSRALVLADTDSDADDSSCTCNSIVTSYIDAIVEVIPPPGGTAATVCNTIVSNVIDRLKTSVCAKATALGDVAGRVCGLVFDSVAGVLEPVTDGVKSVCATILQAFISTFGLASTLDELLTDLQTATNATKALASGLVCGATVCTSDTQKGCSRTQNALTGKTLLASAIDSNQGLCKVIKKAVDDDLCFHGDSMLVREDGSWVSMSNLRVGDRILTASGAFEKVFFFSSQDDNAGPVTFLRLHTNATCGAGADTFAEDGAEHEGRTGRRVCLPLVVTESHYVRLHDGSLKAAFAVEVGDVISYYDDGKKVPATVTRTSKLTSHAIYNPHVTSNSDIVVDGYIASTLTNAVHPDLASSGLHALEALEAWGVDVSSPWVHVCMRTGKAVLSKGPTSHF